MVGVKGLGARGFGAGLVIFLRTFVYGHPGSQHAGGTDV